MDPQQQRVVNLGGKTYHFPADATDAEIAEALERDQPKPIASGEANVAGRSTVADMGLGAAKSIGRTAADWVAFVNGNPGASLSRVIPDLQNENAAQTGGGLITDLAIAAPQAIAGRAGVGTMRAGANWMERQAVPGLTKQGAAQVLERGAALPTAKNAAMLAAEAKATPQQSVQAIYRGWHWVPKTVKPSKLQPAADAMAEASQSPWGGRVSWPKLAMLGGGGYMLGGPKVAAALGAIRILNRPMVRAAGAGALHSTAPAISTMGGAGGIDVAREVFDELERQRRTGGR